MAVTLRLTVEVDKLAGLAARVHSLLGDVLDHTADEVQRNAQERIQHGEKTGRIYGAEKVVGFNTKYLESPVFVANRGKKLGDDGVHQASAPGEAPANDEGLLAGSIQWRATGDLSREVVVGAEYGAVLEYGNVKGTLAPRPYLTPAIEDNREPFRQMVASAVRKGAGG